MEPVRETIVVFHASAELYGSDRTVLQLVEQLGTKRFVVALPRAGPLVEALRDAGAPVEIGPLATFGRATLRPRGFLAAVRAWPASGRWARELLRRHSPSVVHSNTLVIQAGALAARGEGIPHLWHLHEIL